MPVQVSKFLNASYYKKKTIISDVRADNLQFFSVCEINCPAFKKTCAGSFYLVCFFSVSHPEPASESDLVIFLPKL